MFNNVKRVLILDDGEDFCILLKNWINFRGLEALTANCARDAIRILETERIDFIMTDFQMPEMDGVEFLRWCRDHGIRVPVVFMSASLQVIEREQIALADCCATRLSKPLNFKILAAALDAAERHDHHKDCLHQTFRAAVEQQLQLSESDDPIRSRSGK